jgi:hypothetical protein
MNTPMTMRYFPSDPDAPVRRDPSKACHPTSSAVDNNCDPGFYPRWHTPERCERARRELAACQE